MQHGEKLANEADGDLDEAEKQLAALEPERAEKQLAEAEETMRDPDVEYYPERAMLRDRIARDRAQLPEVRAEKARRELAAAVKKQRESLAEPSAALRKAGPALDAPTVKTDDVKAARGAAKDVASALSDGKALEPRDAAYAAEAKELYALVAHTEARAGIAEKRVAFREGPAQAQQEGAAALSRLKSEKLPDKRAALLREALADFQKCADSGHALVLDTPELERASFELGGQISTPAAVVKACSGELKPLQKKLAAAEKAAKVASSKPARKQKSKR